MSKSGREKNLGRWVSKTLRGNTILNKNIGNIHKIEKYRGKVLIFIFPKRKEPWREWTGTSRFERLGPSYVVFVGSSVIVFFIFFRRVFLICWTSFPSLPSSSPPPKRACTPPLNPNLHSSLLPWRFPVSCLPYLVYRSSKKHIVSSNWRLWFLGRSRNLQSSTALVTGTFTYGPGS